MPWVGVPMGINGPRDGLLSNTRFPEVRGFEGPGRRGRGLWSHHCVPGGSTSVSFGPHPVNGRLQAATFSAALVRSPG